MDSIIFHHQYQNLLQPQVNTNHIHGHIQSHIQSQSHGQSNHIQSHIQSQSQSQSNHIQSHIQSHQITQTPNTLSRLQVHESKISSRILKSNSNDDYKTKQIEFRDTCSAIYAIIQDKLFRGNYQSVETYFRKKWDISRAQAYRFQDCYPILEALSGLAVVPHRIRICQLLKRAAGGSIRPDLLVGVWRQVVSVCQGREDMLNSFDWSGYFASKPPKKSGGEREKGESDSEETLAGEYATATAGTGTGAVRSQRRKRSGAEAAAGTLLVNDNVTANANANANANVNVNVPKKRMRVVETDHMGFSTEIELATILTHLAADGKSTWKLTDDSTSDQLFIC